MRFGQHSIVAVTIICFGAIVMSAATAMAAASEKVIYNFGKGAGYAPWSGVIADENGNLYGTAPGNGPCPPVCGYVYELSPTQNGSYQLTTLHVFRVRNGDGAAPMGGLVRDSAGNLFGTTRLGGSTGNGTVFELSPSQTGWIYNVLYSFLGSPNDGAQPRGSLIVDSSGSLYGTTFNGGSYGYGNGTAFKLTPSQTGWTETVIHVFGAPGDGGLPQAGMTFDSAGNLYGTTLGGGLPTCYLGCGTVYELSNSGGVWTESVLYSFQGYPDDGFGTVSNVVFDAAGNLYGTTQYGGGSSACNPGEGCGIAFQLKPSGGTWLESSTHIFRGIPDGAYPNGIAMDSSGNIYGATFEGGASGACFGSYGCGTVYALTPNGAHWSESVLHSFHTSQNLADGHNPLGGVLVGPSGMLFGTTYAGGVISGEGTAFVVKP